MHASFCAALELYKGAAIAAAKAENEYRVAHATALLAGTGTADVRKARADIETGTLRIARDHAAVLRDVALQAVEYLKAHPEAA